MQENQLSVDDKREMWVRAKSTKSSFKTHSMYLLVRTMERKGRVDKRLRGQEEREEEEGEGK